ncbi:iron ABC transporter permease, partial [Wolbachia pipientis]|nr:iron ABC transporter permease [Wolbachia pipientis]
MHFCHKQEEVLVLIATFVATLIAIEKKLQKKGISYSSINTNADYHNKRSVSGAIPLICTYV